MRNHWIVCAVVCFVALPTFGGGLVGIEDTDDPKDAHRALREAVENIRVHYAPDTYQEFEFQAGLNRPSLGIILRGGSWFSRGEKAEAGAEIVAVTPGSSADEAGLQAGDVIIAWNGEMLGHPGEESGWTSAGASRELVARSRELEEGESVTLRFLRDKEELEVTLVARTIEFPARLVTGLDGSPDVHYRVAPVGSWQSAQPWFLPRGWLDMELVEINPELGNYFGSDTGVLVVRGPVGDETLGLAGGDVILRIGDREVENPEHVMRILRSYEPDEELSVDIVRHGQSMTLTGTVPETSFQLDYRFREQEEAE